VEKIIGKVSGRLAQGSSRRGFLATLGKLVVGTAAVAGGVALGPGAALASLGCCSGTDCQSLGYYGCPPSSCVGYTWYCCANYDCSSRQTACNDCYSGADCNGAYQCTYSTPTALICPCEPAA
jgi:hypothetical protein